MSALGCSSKAKREEAGEPQVVTDASKIIDALSDFEEADLGVSAAQTWEVPLGTKLYHTGGSWAACMLTPDSAMHPNTLGAFSTASGRTFTLMEEASLGRGYSFYDVRMSESIFAWLEIDYIAGAWALLACPFTDGSISGNPITLDSGDQDWEPASFTCRGSSVIWQKMPQPTGKKRAETSQCLMWTSGNEKGSVLWESTGRFATKPRVAGRSLTIAPRVRNDEGTFYGMTAIDLDDTSHGMLDQLVLPSGIRPFEAVYAQDRFAFSIEASYESGGSLGKMGTFIGREGGSFVFFAREPLAQIMFSGSRFLIKTQSAHYALDIENEKIEGVSGPDRSLGFGEFPASEGEATGVLTYATIRDAKGAPASGMARWLSLQA
nr:hypothetical protein [Collinsella urealyticum]